ncbi:MAG: hypothetical protein L3K08_05800, partial [Thermoplasmata archaeon]|nr:hypothetical protein [Thermoplasmata archaeon]
VLSPPNYPLEKVQRLFGYLQAVLEADLRAENLRLAPDVEELARRAIQLPEPQRTLFQLVRTLRVGVYKARLIQIVEGAGHSGHAPLPTLDLGRYTPEFRAASEPETPEGEHFFAPENVPAWDSTPTHPGPGPTHPPAHASGRHAGGAAGSSAPPHPSTVRCVGCGGLASLEHACGATLCRACLSTFRTCPKCQQAIVPPSLRDLDPGPTLQATEHVGAHASHPNKPTASGSGTHRTHPQEPSGGHAEPAGRTHPATATDAARSARPPPVRIREIPPNFGRGALPSTTMGRGPTPPPTRTPPRSDPPNPVEPPSPERPPRPAHRADEEPRL